MFRTLKPRAFSLVELSIVMLIIGVLIVGVISAKQLIARSRVVTAMNMTNSAPISGIVDNKLWLESSRAEISLGHNLNDGDAITSWADNSSNKSASTISAVGNGPTYANSINHIQAVKFGVDSNSNHLQIDDATFLNGTDYTIIVTEKRIATNSGGGNYLLGQANAFAVGYQSSSAIIQSHGESARDENQANIESISAYLNKPRTITFTHSELMGNLIYINGTLSNVDDSDEAKAHLSGLSTLAIGKNYNGEIGEIAIFDRYLKSEERKSVEDYMSRKWQSPNNRDVSASCTGGTTTSTGCQQSCAAPTITGVASATSIAAGVSRSFSCNAPGYTGSTPSYTCSNSTLSPAPDSGDCVRNGCDTNYFDSGSDTCVVGCSVASIAGTSAAGTTVANGTVVQCNLTGYNNATLGTCAGGGAITGSCGCDTANNYVDSNTDGVCEAPCTLSAASTDLPSDITVLSGSNSYNCSTASGYSGTLSYSCNNGTGSVATKCTPPASSIDCTGGYEDESSMPGYKMHVFTSSDTINCTSSVVAQVLVVAGGGGGGGCIGGGGGAGGVVYNNAYTISAGDTDVVVGLGGAGGNGWNSSNQHGKKGGDSSFGSMTATGGGGGADHRYAPHPLTNDGGSGGGDALHNIDSGGIQDYGTGIAGQGHNGGSCGSASNCYNRAGGGGGAGNVGGNSSSSHGGNGGPGVDYTSIFSSNYGDNGWFASGGGGGVRNGYGSIGTVSAGGGAIGSLYTIGASSAADNTGGGGGGAGFNNTNTAIAGGKGGSGIVIIRYAN